MVKVVIEFGGTKWKKLPWNDQSNELPTAAVDCQRIELFRFDSVLGMVKVAIQFGGTKWKWHNKILFLNNYNVCHKTISQMSYPRRLSIVREPSYLGLTRC